MSDSGREEMSDSDSNYWNEYDQFDDYWYAFDDEYETAPSLLVSPLPPSPPPPPPSSPSSSSSSSQTSINWFPELLPSMFDEPPRKVRKVRFNPRGLRFRETFLEKIKKLALNFTEDSDDLTKASAVHQFSNDVELYKPQLSLVIFHDPLSGIVPNLLVSLQEGEGGGLAMAASRLLALLAQSAGGNIALHVNIKLNELITSDESPAMKVSTLLKIFEFLRATNSSLRRSIFGPYIGEAIINILFQSIIDSPNAADKACGALYLIPELFEDVPTIPIRSKLDHHFEAIVSSLLCVTEKEHGGESRLRTAETLNGLLRGSTDETAPMVLRCIPAIMTMLHQSCERESQNDVQGLVCRCLRVIQMLGASEATKFKMVDYTNLLRNGILKAYSGIFQGFKHTEKMQLLIPVAAQFLQFLNLIYVGKDMDDVVMKAAIGVIGDMADTLGTLPMLQRDVELCSPTVSAESKMVDHTNLLRNRILKAYSGIFQGFKNSEKMQLLVPVAAQFLQFLNLIYVGKDMDDVVMKAAIGGVIGDLDDTLGTNAGSLFQQSVTFNDFLNGCLSSDDHLIKESAERAKLAISRPISV